MASRHPATAAHLAKKLCVYFVNDRPSASLLNEVASVFTDSGGDIKKVLIAILTSADFNNIANYRGLVKTPLEFVTSLHRNLGVWSPIDPFRNRLVRMGQGLYEKAPPTGYKEAADEWLNTDVMFNEVSFAYETTIPRFGSIGGGVKGGLCHGPAGFPSSLIDANLDSGRYIRSTVEFRNIFSDVLVRHFGVNATELNSVFPGQVHLPVGLFV